tara:strand:+ start:1199 stop:1438 length:240 start_codon:yes stop_codon:yes gene_type:complete
MKIKTIYWIIGIAIVLWIWQKMNYDRVVGRSCMSTYGEQGIKFEGKCQKCPKEYMADVEAPSPFLWECHKRKLTAIAMP